MRTRQGAVLNVVQATHLRRASELGLHNFTVIFFLFITKCTKNWRHAVHALRFFLIHLLFCRSSNTRLHISLLYRVAQK